MSATGSESESETLFQSWLERGERGLQEPFDELCAAHASRADALRALHAAWRDAERLFAGLDELEAALDELEKPLPDRERAAALLQGLAAEPGRYERLQLLARTAMGEVWRVRDRKLERDVALKTVKEASRHDPRLLRRFLREARLVARLEHPAVVGVHDLGLDEAGLPWFTMPLVSGRTLEQWAVDLAAGRENLARGAAILAEVADALAFAHERGVVHRDLKPQNIVVGERGQVVVLDWGLARAGAELSSGLDRPPDDAAATRDGALVGTPAYMAPEQARGEAAATGPHSDVYALGAILRRLLTGAPPYAADAARAAVEAVKRGPPPPLRSVAPEAPPELASIAERAMRREPRERYASAADLARDLRAWLEGRVVSAHERGAAARALKWLRRNRALAGASALVVALAFGGTLAFSVWRARAAGEILSLSDTALAQELRTRAETLFWPPRAGERAAIETWIAQCTALLARSEEHRRAELALAALQSPDEQQRFRLGLLERLRRDLDELREGEGRHSIAAARTALLRLDELAAGSKERDAAWTAMTARIAANPRYPARAWPRRSELAPLGPDPASGLEEFALLASGSLPVRDLTGRLVLRDDAALVLVLLPGGRCHVGAIYGERAGADPDASLDEAPRREARLEPCYIAKHELTQAQHQRLWGLQPSHHFGSPRLPADSVSWRDLAERLPRAGLALPSGELWEYAARATTQTRWWTGAEPASLVGAANLRGAREDAPLPVGSLRPNAYGLHDTIGNLAEWTLPDPKPGAPGRLRPLRGGSYASTPLEARATAVELADDGTADRRAGVRPAMTLEL